MTEFSIKFSNVENSIEVLSHYAVQLREIEQEVSGVKRNLRGLGSSTYRIYSSISGIDRTVLDHALSMSSLSEALEKICAYYRCTENNIVSSRNRILWTTDDNGFSDITSNVINTINSIWNSIRSLLVSWGIIRAEKQIRVPGEDVTAAQEQEMDLYMKREIEKLLTQERYSEETWKAASQEERENILNEYLQEVAAIMGLEIGLIDFKNLEATEDGYVRGKYSYTNNSVLINTWVMQDGNVSDSYVLLSTVVHELRHAYQYTACSNPEQFVVTEETIQKWQDSFDHYKGQSEFMEQGMTAEEAYEAYRNQDVEVDARWFAGQD